MFSYEFNINIDQFILNIGCQTEKPISHYIYTWSLLSRFSDVASFFSVITNGERYYLPTPPLGQDMTQGQFLSGVYTGLNSEFSFS